MRGPQGSGRHRRPHRWAATGAGATVAAGLTTLALAGTVPLGADRAPAAPAPHATAGRPSLADVLRPPIVGRGQWGADPRILDQKPRYADAVHAVVLHHTGHSNDYDCSDSPYLVRDMYATHAVGKDWGDIGYNFLVDKCGTIFEGRIGGADRPVVGAHTVGLNRGTTGIAAIGTYTEGVPVPKPLQKSLEMLIAWKLGLTGTAPADRARLVSTNDSSRFPKDSTVRMPTVFGHIDGYETNCPGEALMQVLPALRKEATRLQSRAKQRIRRHREGQQKQEAQDGNGPAARRTPGSTG